MCRLSFLPTHSLARLPKPVSDCFMLSAELMKLTGIVVTVLHLLAMVAMHLAGVVNPVKFKEVSRRHGLLSKE